jgi:hypothetical protein
MRFKKAEAPQLWLSGKAAGLQTSLGGVGATEGCSVQPSYAFSDEKGIPSSTLNCEKVPGLTSEYWLHVNRRDGTEQRRALKPDDRPSLHVWVSVSGREYTATFDVEWFGDRTPTIPHGAGWKRTRLVPPFIKLMPNRPSTIWSRKGVRS